MASEIAHQRRRFLGRAAMTIAAAPLGVLGSAAAGSDKPSTPLTAREHTSFGSAQSDRR